MSEAKKKYIRKFINTEEWSVSGVLLFNLGVSPLELLDFHDNLEFLHLNKKHDPKKLIYLSLLTMKGLTSKEISQILNIDNSFVEKIQSGMELPDFSDTINHFKRDDVSLEKKLSEFEKRDRVTITMGTTPTGPITLANAFVIANGVNKVNEMCNKYGLRPDFSLGFNDNLVDMPNSLLNSRKQQLDFFLNDLYEVTGVEVSTIYFSQLQKKKSFRDMLTEYRDAGVFKTSSGISLSVSSKGNGAEFFHLDGMDFHNDSYDYVFDLDGIMSLRAGYANSDIHILGGDQTHINKSFSEFRFPNRTPPLVYVPGVIFGLDGEEMHTSKGNGVFYHNIREGPETTQKIIELSKYKSDFIGPLQYMHLLPESLQSNIYM